MPPSTRKSVPVTKLESLDARKRAAFAISAASPKRPMGTCTRRRCFFSSLSRKVWSNGVLRGPGHSALTLIPSRAWITASSLDMASTAPFEEVYASWGVAAPRSPTNEAVLMMLPPPARRRAGMPYLHPNHTPFTFTSMVRSQIASSVFMASSSSPCIRPALLKITETFPKAASVAAIIPSTASGCATFTSAAMAIFFPAASLMIWAVSSAAALLRSAHMTLAPSIANKMALDWKELGV
mmetsp:Transcript_16314/g.32509  ORF Transcript_16314/g.32509 Transcript_16314/m.32509 type:complete len:239 (+) Transcript_16314:228-944(+)